MNRWGNPVYAYGAPGARFRGERVAATREVPFHEGDVEAVDVSRTAAKRYVPYRTEVRARMA